MAASGLPVGVQIVAGPWREARLIRVASYLEGADPWSGRRPVRAEREGRPPVAGSDPGVGRCVLFQFGLADPGGVHLGVAAAGRHQLVVGARPR